MKGKSLKLIITLALICALCAALIGGASAAGSISKWTSDGYWITYSYDTAQDPYLDQSNSLAEYLGYTDIDLSHILIPDAKSLTVSSGTGGYDVPTDVELITQGTGLLTINASGNTYAVKGDGGSLIVQAGTVNAKGTFANVTGIESVPIYASVSELNINDVSGHLKLYLNAANTGKIHVYNGDSLTISGTAEGYINVAGHFVKAQSTHPTILNVIGNAEAGASGSFSQINVSGGSLTDVSALDIENRGSAASHDAALYVTGGRVVLDDGGTTGIIHGNTGDGGTIGRAVYVTAADPDAPPTVNITSYKITTGDRTDAGTTTPIVDVNGGTTTISGGSIYPFVTKSTDPHHPHAEENEAVYVTGGTLNLTGGVQVTSYHDDNAVDIDGGTVNISGDLTTVYGYSSKAVDIAEGAIVNFSGGTVYALQSGAFPEGKDVDAQYGYYNEGKYNQDGGTVIVNTSDAPTAKKVYGVYNKTGDPPDGAFISGGNVYATADTQTSPSSYAHGVYNESGVATIDGTANVDVTATAHGTYLYGVYSAGTNSDVTIGGNCTIDVTANGTTINDGRYFGIQNDAGTVTMNGGTVTVGKVGTDDAVNGTNRCYGLRAPAQAVSFMDGGRVEVYGDYANGYFLSNSNAQVHMRGGYLYVDGNNSYAVLNDNGLFTMGVHEQLTIGEDKGKTWVSNVDPGYPFIEVESHQTTYGVYSQKANSVIKLFAGEIDANGDVTRAVFVENGNVQVLTNEHDARVTPPYETTFKATAKGDNSIAFYASNGNWAIRGRGSVFNGESSAFTVNKDSFTDGGVWYDPTCDTTNLGDPHAPLSGGTFIGGMNITAQSGVISNLMLGNHYLRDDSAEGINYNDPSDGTRWEDANVQTVTKTVTVVDAEWELRYAMEYDNDINDYTLPCAILLDDGHELHGTGPEDGDVDIADNVNPEVATSVHFLDLNGFDLTAVDDDNGIDNRYELTDPGVKSVIEVGYGELTTVDKVGGGKIEYKTDNEDSAAIHVTGGRYNNGILATAETPAVQGADIYGAKKGNGNALRVNEGEANLNSGVVGGESSTVAVLVEGLLTDPATLNVYGGTVTGNTQAGIGIYISDANTGVDDLSRVNVFGGYIYGDAALESPDYLIYPAIYVNGGYAVVNTEDEHEIGTCEVLDGLFDLYDGSYKVEGELVPSTIYALNVSGEGSAYVDGGVVLEASKVEGSGELKVDDGVFKNNLSLTDESRTYFVYGAENTFGAVEGSLEVNNADVTLLVQFGDFEHVITDVDGANNIALHGGAYGRIETVNGRIIGEIDRGDDEGLIPVNHYLSGSDGVLYRTDVSDASADDDDRMWIENICDADDEYNIYYTLANGKAYTMPGFIDLCAAEKTDDKDIPYFFRTAGQPGAGGTFTCCDTTGKPGTLEVSKTFTLDLNGYDLTSSDLDCNPIDVVEGGKLTVQDTSDAKDGRIVDPNDIAVIVGGGLLTLNSGTIEAEGDGYNAVRAFENGSVTVNGGEIIGIKDALAFESAGTLDIKGGLIYATGGNSFAVAVSEDGATLKISGGDLGSTSFAGGGLRIEKVGTPRLTAGRYKSIVNDMGGVLTDIITNSKTTVTAASVEYVGSESPTPTPPDLVVPRTTLEAISELVDGSSAGTDWEYKPMFTLKTGGQPGPTPPGPEPGPGGGGGGGGAPQGIPVIVDGVTYNIGTRTVTGTVTTETVDQTRLTSLIANAKESVVIPISAMTDTSVAQLVVKNIEDMAARSMTLTVQSGGVSYEIRTTSVDTAKIMSDLGATNSAEVPFNVSIAKNAAAPGVAGKYQVIGVPVDFTVTATYGGKTTEVTKYAKYTSRVFEVTEEQARQITTAVVNEADGSVRHVPTFVYKQDGKWYARVSSLTSSVYVLIHNEQSFADAAGTWYQSAVNEMASRKILNGRAPDFFDGGADITRAEFAAIVVRALGLPENGSSAFTDVPAGAWYYGAVGKAAEYGIIEGVGDNRFEPLRNITRQEAMLMLQRAAKITEYVDVKAPYGSFADLDTVSDFAESAMYWNLENGFIVGSDGLVRPLDNISRAESSTIILRLLQKSKLIDVRANV